MTIITNEQTITLKLQSFVSYKSDQKQIKLEVSSVLPCCFKGLNTIIVLPFIDPFLKYRMAYLILIE